MQSKPAQNAISPTTEVRLEPRSGATWGNDVAGSIHRRRAWLTVFALTIAYMHSNIARQAVPMFVGPIQTDLGLSDVGVSLVGGLAFALFYSVVGVPLGWLVDRSNRRRLILISILFWTVMTALGGWSAAVIPFLFGRIGLGISEAAVVPASLSIFHDLFPRQRLALAVNTFFTGVWLGNGLAFILGAAVLGWAAGRLVIDVPLLGPHHPWQIAFLFIAALGIPVFLLSLVLKEPVRVGHVNAQGTAQRSMSDQLREVGRLFLEKPRLYVNIFAGITLYSAAVSGAAFWAVEYFVRVFGTDRGYISYVYGIQGFIAGSGGLVVSGWLADRWERSGRIDAKLRIGLCSLLILIPLGGLLALTKSEGMALALYIAITFLTPVAYGTSTSALQCVTPGAMQGVMTGLFTFVTNAVGMGLGPTVVALASAIGGRQPSAIALGIAISLVTMLPMAIVLLQLATRPYRQHIEAVR